MKQNVERFIDKCITCRRVKSKVRQHGLYTPLSISKESRVDLFMNFILGLPKYRRGNDSIYIIVDSFSKMTYFIACHKSDNASYIADLFLRDIQIIWCS